MCCIAWPVFVTLLAQLPTGFVSALVYFLSLFLSRVLRVYFYIMSKFNLKKDLKFRKNQIRL